jgi:hypothetical protein
MTDTFSTRSGSSPGIDFEVENHGSIFLLRPISPAASDWLHSHHCTDHEIFGNLTAVPRPSSWMPRITLSLDSAE